MTRSRNGKAGDFTEDDSIRVRWMMIQKLIDKTIKDIDKIVEERNRKSWKYKFRKSKFAAACQRHSV